MDLTPPDLSRFTPRLHVRLLTPADRAGWVRAHELSADHFDRWMPSMPDDVSLDGRFDQQVKRVTDGIATGAQYVFVAEHRDASHHAARGPLVAFLSLTQIFRGAFQNAYAGWRVSAPHCRAGLGTEAVLALLDIAFDHPPHGLGLHRVQANIIPTNEPSLKLADKVGFRREGYAVRYLEIAGQWQDHVMLAKLAEEHVLGMSNDEI